MKLKSDKTKNIGIRVTEEQHQRYKKLSQNGVDISEMLRELIDHTYVRKYGEDQ